MGDMNQRFSPEQSRSHIYTMLVSAGLEKYMDSIIKAGIDFHAFCNMTREDMRIVGIKNCNDQDILLEQSTRMSCMYKELNEYEIDWEQVRKNLVYSSEMLAGSLVQLREAMLKNPTQHQSLVDTDTPSTRVILTLLDLIESRIDFMDQDLKGILQKYEVPSESRHSRKKILIGGALFALTAASAVWLTKKPKIWY